MIKSLLDKLNIKVVRPEGNGQYLCVCPICGGEKMYINRQTGLWDCKRNCGSGNAYQLVGIAAGKEGKEALDILEQCGLNTDGQAAAPVSEQDKKLAITSADIRQMTDEELTQVCTVKSLDKAALLKFQPVASKHSPEMLLPAFCPSNTGQVSAFLRCRFDGQKIKTKHGEEKYPLVYGSQHGLFGLKWLNSIEYDELIFAEGWADALAAIEAGFIATASSGGASCFKDDWLPIFEGKTVYIIMDRDAAGEKAAKRAANKIWSIAKETKIIDLPYPVIEGQHGKGLKEFLRGIE